MDKCKVIAITNQKVGVGKRQQRLIWVSDLLPSNIELSIGMMTINALVAADSVMISPQPNFLSTKGLNLHAFKSNHYQEIKSAFAEQKMSKNEKFMQSNAKI